MNNEVARIARFAIWVEKLPFCGCLSLLLRATVEALLLVLLLGLSKEMLGMQAVAMLPEV